MSDNKSNNTAKGGIGFTGLLAIVFIVLKLCHVIDWAWVWVLSPLWISFTVGVLFIIGFAYWLAYKK